MNLLDRFEIDFQQFTRQIKYARLRSDTREFFEKLFSGGKSPDLKVSLKEVDTFVREKASLSMTYIKKAVGLDRPTKGLWKSRLLSFSTEERKCHLL